jgi:hypothetical protein
VLWIRLGYAQKLGTDFRRLAAPAWPAPISGRQFPDFRPWIGGFYGASLCSPFFYFRFGVPETRSILRDGNGKASVWGILAISVTPYRGPEGHSPVVKNGSTSIGYARACCL